MLASAVALVATLAGGAVVCHGGLDEAREPAGWRTFAKLPNRGGFEVSSRYVGKMLYGHHADGLLYDPRLCRYSGISVDSWLAPSGPGNSRSPEQLSVLVAPDGDVHVITGEAPWTGGAQQGPTFIAAFRRSTSTRLGFVSAPWSIASWMLALAVVVSASGVIASSLKIARAQVFARRAARATLLVLLVTLLAAGCAAVSDSCESFY